MKLKRLLTGVLSAVMALSVCAMPALAADDNNAATPTTGSLTITKYEQPIGSPNSEWQDKERGNPLEGVTFTVYKVADVNQTVDASGNVSLRYDLVDKLTKASISIDWDSYITDTEPKQYDSAAIFKALYSQLTADGKTLESWKLTSASAKTNDKGEAKFENLATGVYMVEETSAPAQITIANRTANFMVSIPMTVTNENGTQEITYNVKAEPKNVSTYGGVTLNKYGQVAGDNKTKARIAGAVFQLYRDNGTEDVSNWKPVDLTAKGIKVDGKPVTDTDAKIGEVTTTTTGVNITGLTPGSYYFKEISAPAGYIADTKTEHKFELDANGDVLVDNKKVDGGVVDVVNEKPNFEKTVAKRGATTSAGNHEADYGINDKVPYTLTIKVPENVAELKTFKVTDTTVKEQLEHNKADIKVTGVAKDGTTKVVFAETDYTATVTDDGSNSVMTIDFDPLHHGPKMNEIAGGTITIEYTATLGKKAVIAGDGNLNTADLIYSRTTDSTQESETTNKPYQIEDKSVVYTFGLGIKKVGGSENGNGLNGVTFDLYKKYDQNDKSVTFDNVNNKYIFRGDKCDYITVNAQNPAFGLDEGIWIKVKTLTTDTVDGKAGIARESGLPAGEYKLVETKTVDGYNLLTEPVDAKLNLAYETKWTTKTEYDEDGKLIGRDTNTQTYTYADTKGEATPGTTLTIVNRKGFTLPVTGGFGTLLFSGIGVLLVLAGVCVLFSMKKKNNRT